MSTFEHLWLTRTFVLRGWSIFASLEHLWIGGEVPFPTVLSGRRRPHFVGHHPADVPSSADGDPGHVGRLGLVANLLHPSVVGGEYLLEEVDSGGHRRGDLLLVRTGHLTRARRGLAEGRGWGGYAGGASPGLSFTTVDWLHGNEIAGIATDTWGVEVRPNEFDNAFQPLHQVVIPHLGLFLGELWDLDALAADSAADGVWEFFLVAAPIPVTGAVGAPVNPLAIK